MLKKVTSLSISVIILIAIAPARAFAQTQPAKPKRDLQKSLADVIANSRAGVLTEADIKRLETEGPNPQAKTKGQTGFARKEKILLYSIVAGLVVLAVVLAIKTGKGGHTFCDVDPTDPDCLGSF